MSSSSEPWRLSNAWRSFTAFRAREVTGTHHLVIDGYSVLDRTARHGESIESARFRAGGRSWKLFFYPNGHRDTEDGSVTVLLRLQDNRFLGTADDATATYRVSVLDREGNPAFSHTTALRRYSIGGTSGIWLNVPVTGEEKKAALMRLREDDKLVVRLDVTVHRCEKESRIKWYLRQLLD
ncbi:hypothetical protein ACP70R_007723 [Stipagrostis hirtigluma subsp. patula]